MSRSSGTYTTTVIEHHECHGQTVRQPVGDGSTWSRPCTFAGDVDVLIDPEIRLAAWECPSCGNVVELDWDEVHGDDRDAWDDDLGGDE